MLARAAAVPFLAATLAATSAATLFAQAPTITSPTFSRTRTVWFVQQQNPVGAEVCFGAEELVWDDKVAKVFAAAKPGTRVALGTSMWATLESFTDLKFGDVAVKAGTHYAVLTKTKDGFALGLLDPNAARKSQLQPGTADKQALTATIPLRADTSDASPLRAECKAGDAGRAELTIRFGPHRFAATATVDGAAEAQPYSLPDPRSTSRAAFGKNAFAVVDHGIPVWNEKRAEQTKEIAKGSRWRLGQDWATTLDTNVALALGDKTLAPGIWHLTLGRTDGGWNLVVSDARADLAAKLDGFAAAHVKPVLEVPLATSPLEQPAEKLQIRFVTEGKGTTLAIAFGPERLAVPVATAKT